MWIVSLWVPWGGRGRGRENVRSRSVGSFFDGRNVFSKQTHFYVIYYILSSGGFDSSCVKTIGNGVPDPRCPKEPRVCVLIGNSSVRESTDNIPTTPNATPNAGNGTCAKLNETSMTRRSVMGSLFQDTGAHRKGLYAEHFLLVELGETIGAQTFENGLDFHMQGILEAMIDDFDGRWGDGEDINKHTFGSRDKRYY